MRGRKPTPATLHALHGNPSKRPPRRDPPAPGTLEEPPDWMTADQRAAWAYALTSAPKNVLRAIDGGLLAVYVTAQDLHRQASIALQTEPLVDDDGRASPLVGIITKQALVMLKSASELGFSPVARARLGTAPEDGDAADGEGGETLQQWLARDPSPKLN